MRSRRPLLALLLACAALVWAGPGRAQAPQLRVGVVAADFSGEVLYAQDMGFFKKAGLDVDLQTFTSGGAAAQAVLGGAIDVGLADAVSVAAGHAHGVPFTYIAPAALYTAKDPTYYLAVPESSPIRTAKDLTGKTIAVNGLKNVNQIPTQAWIDANGGDSKTVKFVELPYPSMGQALDQGKVDAAALAEPFVTFAHGKYRILSLGDAGIGPEFLVSGYVATEGWAHAHPDLVRRFAAVMRETAEWANKNRRLSGPILVKYAKLPPGVVEGMARTLYGDRLSPALLQPVIDASAKYDVIPKAFPAREIISAAALR